MVAAVMLAALVAASPAAAWWDYGHHSVARIAMESVRPDTRAGIQRLLREHPLVEHYWDAPESHLGATLVHLRRGGADA